MNLRNAPQKRIGEILVEEGSVSPENLAKALELQKSEGGLIGSILVKHGWVTEDDLVVALSKQLNIPFVRLSSYNVNRGSLKLIPRGVAVRNLFFPFDEDENNISVAMSDPLNKEAMESIEKRVPHRVQVFLSTISEIRDAIELYYEGAAVQTEEPKRE